MILTSEKKKKLYAPYVEILKDWRKQNEQSQRALAEEVGLSPKYVTLVEGGRRVPTLESLLALMATAGLMRSTAEDMLKELLNKFKWQG
jgi:transcriptional regulator with XRE-family HTH domain